MAHSNETLIRSFYEAFQKGDASGMAKCYHPEVVFNDPAFQNLHGTEASDMWAMLLSRAKENLKISFSEIQADDLAGIAKWEAIYPFGAKKRQVRNKISAQFAFKDGKIVKHTDTFPFWKWSRMALGPLGTFLGWSNFLKNKVRSQSANLLKTYRNK